MKKSLIAVISVLLITLYLPLNVLALSTSNNMDSVLTNPSKAPEQSQEELNQDIFMVLLLPSIQNAVNIYYKDYLAELPKVAPYDVTVLSVNRIGGYRTFNFLLKLELHPYLGAHNDVGIDIITLKVNPIEYIKVEKFEHIKSLGLPLYYDNIIKKKLP